MDRLEYIMWRDTIRYKYQLDKTLQLSEQEIEEKINELEKTMSESMPYFFVGKDSNEIRTNVDHNIGHFGSSGTYVVIAEDYYNWQNEHNNSNSAVVNDTLLFCGDVSYSAPDIIRKKRWAGISLSKQEKETLWLKCQNSREALWKFKRTPIRKYSEIIEMVRTIDCFNDVDFTNINVVKNFFREQHIFTFREFAEQNGYEFQAGHRGIFFLSNGIQVIRFGYERSEFGYSEEDDKDDTSDE